MFDIGEGPGAGAGRANRGRQTGSSPTTTQKTTMKKVQIVGGLCVGAILVVTVSYFIFQQPKSSQQMTFESDNHEDRDNHDDDRRNTKVITLIKSNGEDTIKSKGDEERHKLTCPPCPSVEPPKFIPPPPIVESQPDPPAMETMPQSDTPPSTQDESGKPKWAMSSTTQLTFSGGIVRDFPMDELKFRDYSPESYTLQRVDPWCEKWAVMTTILFSTIMCSTVSGPLKKN